MNNQNNTWKGIAIGVAIGWLIVLLIGLTVGCTHVPVSPAPPPPVKLVDVAVEDRDQNGVVISGAVCQDADKSVTTNQDGYGYFGAFPPQRRMIVCRKDGYEEGVTIYDLEWPHPQIVKVTQKALHVNPSTIPLTTIARIKGAMWPQTLGACGNLSFGPRPGQDDNIIATGFITNYSDADRMCIIGELRKRGYTHVVMGPLVDSDGYHGIWTPNDWRGANFDKFLDAIQLFADHGLTAVVFGKPDGWRLRDFQNEFTGLLSQPRAQKLIRIFVPMGWEPRRYADSSCTWAEAGRWARQILPNALILGHTESDQDAPVGTDALCNDDDKVWNPGGNAAGWGRVAPYYHGWLFQFGAFAEPDKTGCDRDHPEYTSFQCFVNSFNPDYRGSFRDRFDHGYAGWPKFSAWGQLPLLVYAGEYSAYWRFWMHRTEAEGVKWGDAAVKAGAAGCLDSCSVDVPPIVR